MRLLFNLNPECQDLSLISWIRGPCLALIERKLGWMLRYLLKLCRMFGNEGSKWAKCCKSFVKTSTLVAVLANSSSSSTSWYQRDELLRDSSYILINMSLILHLNPECQEIRAQFEQIRWIEGYMSDKWPDLGLISWIRAMFGTYRVEIETHASISAEIALYVQKWWFKLCEKLYSFVKTLILAAGLC